MKRYYEMQCDSGGSSDTEYIKRLQEIIRIKEEERLEWSNMCISKQKRIDELIETRDYLQETSAEYKCDRDILKNCVEEVLIKTNDEDIKNLIHDALFHLCINTK